MELQAALARPWKQICGAATSCLCMFEISLLFTSRVALSNHLRELKTPLWFDRARRAYLRISVNLDCNGVSLLLRNKHLLFDDVHGQLGSQVLALGATLVNAWRSGHCSNVRFDDVRSLLCAGSRFLSSLFLPEGKCEFAGNALRVSQFPLRTTCAAQRSSLRDLVARHHCLRQCLSTIFREPPGKA